MPKKKVQPVQYQPIEPPNPHDINQAPPLGKQKQKKTVKMLQQTAYQIPTQMPEHSSVPSKARKKTSQRKTSTQPFVTGVPTANYVTPAGYMLVPALQKPKRKASPILSWITRTAKKMPGPNTKESWTQKIKSASALYQQKKATGKKFI